MYRPNFAWRVVSPYPTHAGAAAMPECGWWRKREYSNVRDRERVLLVLNGSTSLVCVRDRERVLLILNGSTSFSFVCVIERGCCSS